MRVRFPAIPSLCRPAPDLWRASLGAALAALLAAGCGGGDDDGGGGAGGTPTTTTGAPCAAGELALDDGRCQPPGLPLDMPCPPGEAPLEDGSCQPAGVPPSECGDGFEADGEGGCTPVLPEEPCPDGLLAIPGEAACHEVAPCGAGTWGDIPVEADTQFVDASYSGMDGDGTQARPWTTIQEGVDAAAEGAIVAIAAGTYQEPVELASGAVRLWGRCPSMVTIESAVGPSGAIAVVYSDGSEIHDLAITGAGAGLGIAAGGVVLDRVWIHDTGWAGVIVDGAGAGAAVRGSLLERTHQVGVAAQGGATVTIEGSAVRDSLPLASGQLGRAVFSIASGSARTDVTVRASVIERATDVGIIAGGSDLLVEGVAVRDTAPAPGVPSSPGVGIAAHGSDVTIRGSTIERAHASGVEIAGSTATLERVTVKDTLPLPMKGPANRGIGVLDEGGVPSALTLRRSVVAGSPQMAVDVFRSSAVLESVLVRDNMIDLDAAEGAAILVEGGDAEIRYTQVTGNALAGLSVRGGEALFEASVVRDMNLDLGAGICVTTIATAGTPPGTLTVRSSLLQECSLVGALAYEAPLVVETSVIRDVLPDELGYGGDAVSVIDEASEAGTLRITGTLLDAPARAGISSFGGRVDHGACAILCAKYGLVAEPGGPFTASFGEEPASACGCPDATGACEVQSPGIPSPLAP